METEQPHDQIDNNLKGLGGWLILVGLEVVFQPLWLIYAVIDLQDKIFGGIEYSVIPGFVAFILTELVVNILLLLVCLYRGYSFITKNRLFPKLHIGVLGFAVCFAVWNLIVYGYFLPENTALYDEKAGFVFQDSFYAAIWIPYTLISKRVKATFVNPELRQTDAEIFS